MAPRGPVAAANVSLLSIARISRCGLRLFLYSGSLSEIIRILTAIEQGDAKSTDELLAFSGHAEILATGVLQAGDQQGVQLWEPQTGRPLSPLESSGEVLNMAFLPDGKTLLTYNHEQNFRLWDISARTNIAPLRVLPGHENEIWSVALAPNSRMVASGSKDGMIKVWNTEAFLEQPEVKDRIDAPNIAEIGFSQDGRTMYSLSLDSALGSWDTETLRPQALGDLPHRFRVAVISPLGTQLAFGLTNGAFEVWRIVEPKNGPQFSRELLPPQPKSFEPYFITLKKDAELSPAFPLMTWSGDGKELAAFVNDLYIWDVATGQRTSKLSLPVKPDAIALSLNGGILAAASGPEVHLWEARTGRKLSTCVGHKESSLELAFSPDGKTLASANFDNTAALWDVPSGSRRWPLNSHTLAVPHLAFSPDGRTLVTLGADDTLRFWHVQTGRELMAIETPFPGWGGRVRFSPEGAVMAVGSPAQIRFFRAPPLAEIDAAEARKAGKQ